MQLPFGSRKETASIQLDRAGRHELGEFSANNRVIFLSIIPIGIGVLSAFAALALLRLIGLFTGLTSRQQARNVDFCLLLGFLIFLNKMKALPAKAVLCVSLYRRAVDNQFEIVRATYGQRSDCGWEARRNNCPPDFVRSM